MLRSSRRFRSLTGRNITCSSRFRLNSYSPFADIRRGREVYENLKKHHYVKVYDEDQKIYYYKKTMGESSKNHASDSENLSNSGLIPCLTNSYGVNCGETFGLYLSLLHESNEYLFQKPQRAAGWFRLDDPTTVCCYESSRVGKNAFAKMLPELCAALGLEHYTNHSVRPTAIGLLKSNGFEDRQIVKVIILFEKNLTYIGCPSFFLAAHWSQNNCLVATL